LSVYQCRNAFLQKRVIIDGEYTNQALCGLHEFLP
jgi:hypothetical protein